MINSTNSLLIEGWTLADGVWKKLNNRLPRKLVMTRGLPRKLVMTAILLILFTTAIFAQNINISGENTATFIHRTAKDSLNHYFENELKFRLDRGIFSFGMSFIAELPI